MCTVQFGVQYLTQGYYEIQLHILWKQFNTFVQEKYIKRALHLRHLLLLAVCAIKIFKTGGQSGLIKWLMTVLLQCVHGRGQGGGWEWWAALQFSNGRYSERDKEDQFGWGGRGECQSMFIRLEIHPHPHLHPELVEAFTGAAHKWLPCRAT